MIFEVTQRSREISGNNQSNNRKTILKTECGHWVLCCCDETEDWPSRLQRGHARRRNTQSVRHPRPWRPEARMRWGTSTAGTGACWDGAASYWTPGGQNRYRHVEMSCSSQLIVNQWVFSHLFLLHLFIYLFFFFFKPLCLMFDSNIGYY